MLIMALVSALDKSEQLRSLDDEDAVRAQFAPAAQPCFS
jgi:hypothetical protein